jgi:hypothetical protein
MAVKMFAPMLALSLVSGCAGFSGEGGDKPEGTRLIEGRLQVPDEDLLGRQVTGLQLAALHLDAAGGVTAFPSDVFDPSVQRSEASFVATVSGGVDVVLVLQVPSASQIGPGSFLGVFVSDDGATLVPRGEDDVSLGLVRVATGQRKPGDTTLSSAAASPAEQTDTDGDGVSNATDDDDDDDGTADANDTDIAGDGIDDALQVLAALADVDADGVADVLQ